jgi:hypothetical protein
MIAFSQSARAGAGAGDHLWACALGAEIPKLEERLKDYTVRHQRANAFDLRYAADVRSSDTRWD